MNLPALISLRRITCQVIRHQLSALLTTIARAAAGGPVVPPLANLLFRRRSILPCK